MEDVYEALEDVQELEEFIDVNGVVVKATDVFTNQQIDILNGAFMEDGEWNATQLEYIVSLARSDR